MAGETQNEGAAYSSKVGLIYVFNLIVGTGALTMPSAFHNAGWLLSMVIVIVLSFMSYLTVTFVIECMASANAVLRHHRFKIQEAKVNAGDLIEELFDEDDENKALLKAPGYDSVPRNLYDIRLRVEMGKMSELFFNKIGVVLFYLCITIYLYGDLAIYAAAVPKSLRDVTCTFKPHSTGNISYRECNVTLDDAMPCWENSHINRMGVYRLYVAGFTFLLGPFVFFNVQKTKWLQIFTTIMRWLAFILMIILAVIKIAKGQGRGHPDAANFNGIPNLFGVCIYSFMCHHSLPSLVTPIKDKSKLLKLFAADYTLILGFYCLLSFTGIFAFNSIQDLYTLNFDPSSSCGDSDDSATNVPTFQYFLSLFPVFTLSTNFPIIAITLRNNLKTLTSYVMKKRKCSNMTDRLFFPLATLIPPIIVALITNNLQFLVGITGSYAGVGIQYIVPALLVYFSRHQSNFNMENKHISPFKHTAWVLIVLVWAFVCISFVTVNHIISGK